MQELTSPLNVIQPGAFYLTAVDEMGRRNYSRKPPTLNQVLAVGKPKTDQARL